ncbi:MAG: hypothetical protein ACI8PZ_005287 [Myxococcota bacterium]
MRSVLPLRCLDRVDALLRSFNRFQRLLHPLMEWQGERLGDLPLPMEQVGRVMGADVLRMPEQRLGLVRGGLDDGHAPSRP